MIYADFQCICLPGFERKFPRNWYENKDGSGGCVRNKGASVCRNGEGFVKVGGLKIPDTSVATVKVGLRLNECQQECLRNCSCNAYAVADARNGGSGCLAWHGDLVDTKKLIDQGQDLYVRVDAVELVTLSHTMSFVLNLIHTRFPRVLLHFVWSCFFFSANYNKKSKEAFGRKKLVVILVASVFVNLLLLASVYYYLWNKKGKGLLN